MIVKKYMTLEPNLERRETSKSGCGGVVIDCETVVDVYTLLDLGV
jgi:hypothetical protein